VPGQHATIVRLRDVELAYTRRPVLRDVQLEIREGDFLGIVGPNGAGKSTLVKGILGLMPARRGRVEYQGDRRALRFGYVPQRETLESLFFPLTAFELVLMGRYPLCGPLRWPGRRGRDAAQRALEHVGVADLAGRRLADLSGGQLQRVLLARALALEPRVLVLDEPTNGMDLESEHALMELIAELHVSGLTVIMISHLLNVVLNYVRSLVLMGDSTFASGPIDDVLTPENLRRLYGTEVGIHAVDGRRVVLPGRSARSAT
jgi:manganese/zinc/iron transport system ATP- binding protein